MKRRLKKMFKSNKGGIPTIITIVATTIVAMGLFSYTIMNQSTAVKEAGDKALFEQSKINILLENSDYVTGKTVVSYIDRLGVLNVLVYESDGITLIEKDQVDKQAIFESEPVYNQDGKIETAIFTKVNLGT